MSLIYSQFPSPFGYLPMRASRLNCHVVYLGVMVPFASRCVYPTAPQFSAGIVFLCEDLRDSHIIRERPGSWHRRKGLEPSSGGFGDRCSAIKLRLHMSPMDRFEPPRLVGTYCPSALPLSYIGIQQGPWFGPLAVNSEVTNPGPPGPPYLAGTDARIPWTHAMWCQCRGLNPEASGPS